MSWLPMVEAEGQLKPHTINGWLYFYSTSKIGLIRIMSKTVFCHTGQKQTICQGQQDTMK